MRKWLPIALLLLTGCAKKVTAPVPGSKDTLDAYAFRVVSDAQAAIHSVKTWETCSDQKFPASVFLDGQTEPCDATAGTFPVAGRKPLFDTENAYNLAQAAGKAYHDGKSLDAVALAADLSQLGNDIASLLTKVGNGGTK